MKLVSLLWKYAEHDDHAGKNILDNHGVSPYYVTRAEVVELVDALRSGRSGSNPVGVRVPPPAPFQSECSLSADFADERRLYPKH